MFGDVSENIPQETGVSPAHDSRFLPCSWDSDSGPTSLDSKWPAFSHRALGDSTITLHIRSLHALPGAQGVSRQQRMGENSLSVAPSAHVPHSTLAGGRCAVQPVPSRGEDPPPLPPRAAAPEPSAGARGLASARMITLIMEAARQLQHILWHVNCRERTLSAVSFLTREKQYRKKGGGEIKLHPPRLYPKYPGRSLHLFSPSDSLWQEGAPRGALL